MTCKEIWKIQIQMYWDMQIFSTAFIFTFLSFLTLSQVFGFWLRKNFILLELEKYFSGGFSTVNPFILTFLDLKSNSNQIRTWVARCSFSLFVFSSLPWARKLSRSRRPTWSRAGLTSMTTKAYLHDASRYVVASSGAQRRSKKIQVLWLPIVFLHCKL